MTLALVVDELTATTLGLFIVAGVVAVYGSRKGRDSRWWLAVGAMAGLISLFLLLVLVNVSGSPA